MATAGNQRSEPGLPARSIDAIRPLKVICIGAGISGILAAINLPRQVRNLELVIYDKNEEIGGTWFENKYPGCACDIPAHCYQLSFEANPAWSSFYATAPEILQYWQRVADKHGCMKYMKLGYRALEARWDPVLAKWKVELEDVRTGSTFKDQSDVLMTAIGSLNEWRWPEIPGLEKFKGKLLHSAAWDESYDYKGKRVAVIGAGSSGIQIVPSIQPVVKQLDHYVRGRTWIASTFAREELDRRGGNAGNFQFSEEEKAEWNNNPTAYLAFRKKVEAELQGGHLVTMRGSDMQKMAREDFTKSMRARLSARPEIADHLLPSYPPLCKRLTPGPGYLEALTADNVSTIPKSISRITASGVMGSDGIHRPVDAIICATGFDTSYRNRFPISGKDGVLLSEKWRDQTSSYLSMMVDGCPNFFMSLGPNSSLGSGNLLIIIERISTYIGQCLAKIQSQSISTITPKVHAVEAFSKFCDKYFKGTVFSEECSSWYKSGSEGRVTALWPGSSLHAVQALDKPRWEDFDYDYIDKDSFGWFGNGWSEKDTGDENARTYYLYGQNMLHWPLLKDESVAKNGDAGAIATTTRSKL